VYVRAAYFLAAAPFGTSEGQDPSFTFDFDEIKRPLLFQYTLEMFAHMSLSLAKAVVVSDSACCATPTQQ
jgi:hypothetical protein